MDKLNTIEKEWIKTLESNSPSMVIPVLRKIKNSGSVRILPFLFKLINSDTDDNIRNSVLQLISEIKTKDAVPYIVESIENHEYGEYLTPLIAACWQSGLDFSGFLPVFVKIFIVSDYVTAIEAFTVIEESMLQCKLPRFLSHYKLESSFY
jgi:hypothetical protein